MSLKINNLTISAKDGSEILHDLSLTIQPGELHVVMGPNGAGKSTLANSIAGHPNYTVNSGTIQLFDQDLTEAAPDVRARSGLFLSMQYIPQIEGVGIGKFLRVAHDAVTGKKSNPLKFRKVLVEECKKLGLEDSFLSRSLGVGFSGGEKKRLEMLQLAVLKPKFAVLDETDSGLDVDALKIVGEGIDQFSTKETGVLLITHYARLLQYMNPTHVHVLIDGKFVEHGGMELVEKIEAEGYTGFQQ